MSKVNVGFIGYGSSVHIFHAPFVAPNPNLNIYAFFQRKPPPSDPSSVKPGAHCTVDYPDARHYSTAEEFFADPKIDLVIVNSHTDTHARFAEQALKAGKHVVVEKPFALSSKEADHVIAVAKEAGKLVIPFQNRRWDGDFLTVSKLIKDGAFGTITEFEDHYNQEMPSWINGWTGKEWEHGNGMMNALGTHSIDQVLKLFGRPTSVTAFLRTLRGVEDSEIDDAFTIILQYGGDQKNLLVTVKTTVVSPMKEQIKFLVRGTEGSYIKFGTCAQEQHAHDGKKATDPKFGVEDQKLHGLLTTVKKFDGNHQKYDEGRKKWVGQYPTITGRYLSFYENVVAAIRGEAEQEVKAEHSRDGLRVIELAVESHRKRATVPW